MISVEEDGLLHKLDIINPVMADIGKYSCEINGVSTQAYLDVEGMHFLDFTKAINTKKIIKFHNYLCTDTYSIICKIFSNFKSYIIT